MELPAENTEEKKPGKPEEDMILSMLDYQELIQQVLYGSTELAERVYDVVLGISDGEDCPAPQVGCVENAFADGARCDQLYQRMHDTAERLCKRLDVEEDRDVETMIGSWMDMMHIVAIKMFEYGVQFAWKGNKSAQ